MPRQQILLAVVFIVAMGLFAFQLWSVLRTGHVQWRVRRVHRDHRPVAFWIEVVACAAGLLLFAGLMVASVVKWSGAAH